MKFNPFHSTADAKRLLATFWPYPIFISILIWAITLQLWIGVGVATPVIIARLYFDIKYFDMK